MGIHMAGRVDDLEGKKLNKKRVLSIISSVAVLAVVVVMVGGYMAGRSGSSGDAKASKKVSSVVSIGTCYDLREGILTLRGNVDRKELKEKTELPTATLTIVTEPGTVMPTDCSNLFSEFTICETIDLGNANVSTTKSMKEMFAGCSSLEHVTLPVCEQFAVTDVKAMFKDCSSLKAVDFGNLSTTNVNSFEDMFYGCSSLTALDTSHFDATNAKSFARMFYGCSALESVDIANFNLSNMENLEEMFYDCKSLMSLDVSEWYTGKVTNMSGTFQNCSGLELIPVEGWDTQNCTNYSRMFAGCENLKKLDLTGFDISKARDTSSMFEGCNDLMILVLGDKFTSVREGMCLTNGSWGWTKTGNGTKRVSGGGQYMVLTNDEVSTFFRQEDVWTITSEGKVEEIFLDVPADSWYLSAVQYVFDKKIFYGYNEVTFAPEDTMTRAMFVSALYNMDGQPKVSTSNIAFADVSSEAYYVNAVAWAISKNITSGVSETEFGADLPITRQQAATMLYKYAISRGRKVYSDDAVYATFADQGAVADWAVDAMKWVTSSNIMSGSVNELGETVMDPEGAATRAVSAQMIKNYCGG